jgi:hypothetical protein
VLKDGFSLVLEGGPAPPMFMIGFRPVDGFGYGFEGLSSKARACDEDALSV